MSQIPEHPEDRLPPELEQRLGELYRRDTHVPAELDEAILSAGRKRLANVHRIRLLLRWGVAAAAAALLAVAIWLPVANHLANRGVSSSVAQEPSEPAAPTVRRPQYTMLDAYRVARELADGHAVDHKWDVNGDAIVDRRDVDEIAKTAVRIP